MTKITHKGLWFKYSSLSKEDKNTSKKVFISALLFGFLLGLSLDKSSLLMWSEIFHPSLFYILPAITLISCFFTIKYSYKLYQNQDELYKKFHDFSLIAGFMGFAIGEDACRLVPTNKILPPFATVSRTIFKA